MTGLEPVSQYVTGVRGLRDVGEVRAEDSLSACPDRFKSPAVLHPRWYAARDRCSGPRGLSARVRAAPARARELVGLQDRVAGAKYRVAAVVRVGWPCSWPARRVSPRRSPARPSFPFVVGLTTLRVSQHLVRGLQSLKWTPAEFWVLVWVDDGRESLVRFPLVGLRRRGATTGQQVQGAGRGITADLTPWIELHRLVVSVWLHVGVSLNERGPRSVRSSGRGLSHGPGQQNSPAFALRQSPASSLHPAARINSPLP